MSLDANTAGQMIDFVFVFPSSCKGFLFCVASYVKYQSSTINFLSTEFNNAVFSGDLVKEIVSVLGSYPLDTFFQNTYANYH